MLKLEVQNAVRAHDVVIIAEAHAFICERARVQGHDAAHRREQVRLTPAKRNVRAGFAPLVTKAGGQGCIPGVARSARCAADAAAGAAPRRDCEVVGQQIGARSKVAQAKRLAQGQGMHNCWVQVFNDPQRVLTFPPEKDSSTRLYALSSKPAGVTLGDTNPSNRDTGPALTLAMIE